MSAYNLLRQLATTVFTLVGYPPTARDRFRDGLLRKGRRTLGRT